LKRLLLIIILLIQSCISDNRQLTDLFEKVKDEYRDKKEFLSIIKDEPRDSLFLAMDVAPIKRIMQSFELKNPIDFDYLLKDVPFEIQEEVILYGFQDFLNSKDVNLKKLKIEVEERVEVRRIEEKEREVNNKLELKKIIEENNLNWHIGDTIDVIFKLDVEDDYGEIYYNGYQYSLDFSLADDTLKMKGRIKEKYYDHGNSRVNKHLNLIFKLEVIALKSNKASNYSDIKKVGDDFLLHLESYGRSITK